MSVASYVSRAPRELGSFLTWGLLWLAVATLGAGVFFRDGIAELLEAWQLPEYSHGPLIPVLSALLFLRQLKEVPVRHGALPDRWPGVPVLVLAVMIGFLGNLSMVGDLVAYALIIWVYGILLVSFGWNTGKHFWPPVVHLVYMLPLPAVLYYKVSTYLQFISSELGVVFLKLLGVSVFLDGNIIDLGVYKLHVAEACSGLRYLFPILSFSYIFAVLYRGPMWHKAVLLISAAPITVLMNSVRIAIAGVVVNVYGVEWVEGFTHFFEGWVIFIACILILFLLAWFLLFLRRDRLSLVDALDLDTSGLGAQAARLRLIQPSRALITGALLMVVAAAAWQAVPERSSVVVERDPFALFPREMDGWQAGPARGLSAGVEGVLAADDYLSVDLVNAQAAAPVDLFMAYYSDQTDGGVHSPEICLPGSGWEIAWLERVDISDEIGLGQSFDLNRAIIQKGETRMMVYYWFDQKGRKIAWDMAAKVYLMLDGMTTGRSDGGMVRLTTLIRNDETDAAAEARLQDVLVEVIEPLPRFIPGA
ncbi:VPLPA-CTERM-specific exosortase XrtD [Roseitranquillus sediminis]|uniref:VPLPA-CTERM-specific exosortase XrtD n=1 Tax=Roseitranquillus sediminis TaxID=2809051 RepID=UPI001D0C747B|nr:VPLPA-CTERM-specific exosortase XrtD [Roseitranquillus sediminis]MBM9595723.1 VPLPA-CTERM-specific exosortase XrtD [Roseitranquillus sediminis]